MGNEVLNNDIGPGEIPEAERVYQGGHAAPAQASEHGRKKPVLLAAAAVLLFAGGTALGTVLPDPTESTAYKSLAGEKSTVETERDAALSSYASLKGKYDSLENGMASRESKVAAREAEVGKAGAAVKTAEAAVKAREDAVTGAERRRRREPLAMALGQWEPTSNPAPTGQRVPSGPPATGGSIEAAATAATSSKTTSPAAAGQSSPSQ